MVTTTKTGTLAKLKAAAKAATGMAAKAIPPGTMSPKKTATGAKPFTQTKTATGPKVRRLTAPQATVSKASPAQAAWEAVKLAKAALASGTKPSAKANVPKGNLTKGIKHGQFVHDNGYALGGKGQRRPKKGGGRSGRPKAHALNILRELLRAGPQYYRHLTEQGIKPEPPLYLHGVEPDDLEDWYKWLRKMALKYRKERQWIQRSDGISYERDRAVSETVLGTCIVSWPGKADWENADFLEWIKRTVDWLKERYGEHLVGIYAHTDEPQFHIHCLFHNNGRNVKPLLAGHAAVMEEEKKGVTGKALREAYDNACRKLQDAFYEAVGKFCGLLRKGENPQPRVDLSTALRRRAAKKLEEMERLETVARIDAAKQKVARQRAEREEEEALRRNQVAGERESKAEMLVDVNARRARQFTEQEQVLERLRVQFPDVYKQLTSIGGGSGTATLAPDAAATTAPKPVPSWAQDPSRAK